MSEPNYNTTKCFSENLLTIEMTKAKVMLNKPVYLGLSISDNKTVVYECQHCKHQPVTGNYCPLFLFHQPLVCIFTSKCVFYSLQISFV